jgi:predicted alpha-1,2-mannosidase
MWQHDGHDMVGIHSIPVIVDAWKKGLIDKRAFNNGAELLTLMVQSMINNDGENPKNCWNAYWENGYIPYFAGAFDEHLPKGQSVSITLELAYDWWCIADFARNIGDVEASMKAQKWADCWKNVFDERVGFVRPRAPKTSGGGWREPFDPINARVEGCFWSDYTEANSWIYTWHVFQDYKALESLLGGREKALKKLDEFFATMPKGKGKNSTDGGLTAEGRCRNGQIGQYWHGNEPSHHIIYFYSLWGEREKASKLIKDICKCAYRPLPEGLCGNDDCGQMSAWYLFSMMGFYPFNPSGEGYVIGSAQVEEAVISLPNNKTLRITSGNLKTPDLNGKPLTGSTISHSDIMSGGILSF